MRTTSPLVIVGVPVSGGLAASAGQFPWSNASAAWKAAAATIGRPTKMSELQRPATKLVCGQDRTSAVRFRTSAVPEMDTRSVMIGWKGFCL